MTKTTTKPKLRKTNTRLLLFLVLLFTPFVLYVGLTFELVVLSILCGLIIASALLTLLLTK